MDYSFTKPVQISLLNTIEDDCILILPINQAGFDQVMLKSRLLGGFFTRNDTKLILKKIKSTGFTAKCGENILLSALGKDNNINLVLHGLGETKINEKNQFTEGKLACYEAKGGSIYDKIQQFKISNIVIETRNIIGVKSKVLDNISLALASGIAQKSYEFTKYLTDDKKVESLTRLKNIYISSKNTEIAEKISDLNLKTEAIFIARDLGNEPPNVLFPESYAQIIKNYVAKIPGLKFKLLGKKEMEALGMGSFLGVAMGSDKEPQLVVLEYNGNKDKSDYDIALVGKGLTFDAGGISIKPAGGMEDMKDDMGGSAVCFASTVLAAKKKRKVNIVCALGITENMINGSAQRPSDIVKSMSGQTIEVLNTDAEGRLVLADVLYYTKTKYNPDTIIDFATLTGAVVVALGRLYAGTFSNNQKLADDIHKAGNESGEKCWQLPLHKEYDKTIDSKIADVKNISGGRGPGSITAAQFLQRFIDKHEKWIHIDIAGTGAIMHEATPFVKSGYASGFGVKLIDKYLDNL